MLISRQRARAASSSIHPRSRGVVGGVRAQGLEAMVEEFRERALVHGLSRTVISGGAPVTISVTTS
jgi:hypothetical protein